MNKEAISVFRSPITSCWEGDLDSGVEKIDDAELAAIADHGFNGIWLNQPLRDYTPSKVFPEFGRDSERYLKSLEALSKRAAKRGIRVYMYLLEPRAIREDDPFWKIYPELRGQYFYPNYALCSSRPRVREYLYDSLRGVCSRIDMSFFSITAAEDYNTCIGKLVGKEQALKIHCQEPRGIMVNNTCPLCSKRTGAEIIAELLNTLRDGIVAGNPNAKLVAWDWGWRKLPWPDTEKSILDALREDILFISDFEIGGERERPRKQGIYEYSLGYVGPSAKFSELTAYAKARGRRVGAKLQIGTTHELASVPNLPLVHNLWEKLDRARKHDVSVTIASWNLGTYRTMNTYLFGRAFQSGRPVSWPDFVEMARNYLGAPAAETSNLETAWRCFEQAMEHFPYSVPMLYHGPINYAPAHWLPPRQTTGEPLGLSCYMLKRGDDLDFCLGDYSLDEVIALFGKLVTLWEEGVTRYEKVKAAIPTPSERFLEEYRDAVCVGHVYRSVWNLFRVFRLCRAWRDDMMDAYRSIGEEELANCQALLPLLKEDPRLGMHLECKGYMFDTVSVSEKIDRLKTYLHAEKSALRGAR